MGREWFADAPQEVAESVRIDRTGRTDRSHADDGHRAEAIESYRVTADSRRFLGEFVNRLLGETDDVRTGANHWLYGYYGTGKSHTLAVLDSLLDTEWLRGRADRVWDKLAPEEVDDAGAESDAADLGDLRTGWERVHDDYHVVPISVNLLKYRGQKHRSFSESILRHAHQNPVLTGVDDEISTGLSSHLDVAYFEEWYRTTDSWDDRQDRAAEIVAEKTPDSPQYDWRTADLWEDIQRYSALSDIVLPELFEEATGTRDGYADLRPSDIGPEEAVERLESLRVEREEELGDPVKLVLLLDEVGRFVGTDFERLTELQTLAENVDDVGDGDIQLVATAQAQIEDVRPEFAAHGADFSIVKDRFPHRYQLSSEHVSDVAERRLLRKSETGEQAVRNVLADADVKPTESLVHNEVKRNTKPPLDAIDAEELVAFYPFLPYHAPLFLEILCNLRREAAGPAKSIFSGTARAVPALMHELLESWIEKGERDRLLSLVDFFDQIQPELWDLLPQDVRVVVGTEEADGTAKGERPDRATPDEVRAIKDEVYDDDSDIEEFDLRVAKALVLLRRVHDIVPLNEGNIAVAVMSDLDGKSRIRTANRVEESLDRLQKFVRPTRDEGGPRYRFATRDERAIYDHTERREANPDWDEIVGALDDHLWERLAQDLALPESVPYGESGDEYPVSYNFALDGTDFETTREAEGGLAVDVAVQGVRPNSTTERTAEDTLYWEIDTDGLQDLRKRLVEWWALRDATEDRAVPPAVERDLEQRASAVRRKLVAAMTSGSYTVKDRTDVSGLSKAVRIAVDVAYPDDFHPMLLQVDETRLRELRELDSGDPLPAWARTIQVPSPDHEANRGKQTIQRNVLSLTGRQLEDREEGLELTTVLDGIAERKPFYDDARPALRAILWGFCRKGRLLPVDEAGNTLEDEALLDSDALSTTRLTLLPRRPLGKMLEDGGFKETTETVADGLIALQDANRGIESRLTDLREDVELVAELDVRTDAVAGLLDAFADELATRADRAADRLAVAKSQGEKLGEAIEETNDAREWLETVADVWDRRLASLYRLDAVLTVGDDRFDWVDEQARDAVESRSDAVASFEGEWWTTDGWSAFSSELAGGRTSEDLASALERSWESFAADRDLDRLVARIDDHPWVVPVTEIPAGVHATFEAEFLTPMGRLRRWYETIDRAIGALTDERDGGERDGDERDGDERDGDERDTDERDTDELLEATDDVAKLDPLADAVSPSPDELAVRLDRLSAVVGDRGIEEVGRIGIVPGDRQGLEDHLGRLVAERELEIEETDHGVIVR
ncbi:hypothetical protein [Halorussus ruber]|uniref:hypothetical protein n=1 Tax=Halorussus ruber TaxID=1126238 RepID=UPI001091E6C0|nr:hypothetical protein [Halorussus ruber]